MPLHVMINLLLFILFTQVFTRNSVFARPYNDPDSVLTQCHGSIDYAEAIISEQPVLKEWLIIPQITTYERVLGQSWARRKQYQQAKRELTSIDEGNNSSYPFHPTPGGVRLIRIAIERLILPTDWRDEYLGLMFIVYSNADRLGSTKQLRVFKTSVHNIELSMATSSVRLQIVIPQSHVPHIPRTPVQLNLRYSCIHAEPIGQHESHLSVIPCNHERWDGMKWVTQLHCRPTVYDHLSEIKCISSDALCDGNMDCPTAEDEALDLCGLQLHGWQREQMFRNRTVSSETYVTKCGVESYPCDQSYVSNESPVCVPLAWTCDGLIDCPHGEDEQIQLCSETSQTPGSELCPKRTYPCVEDGQCLPYQMVCDNRADCLAGFDESDEACEWRVHIIRAIAREQQLQNSAELPSINGSHMAVTSTEKTTVSTKFTSTISTVLPTFEPITDFGSVTQKYFNETSVIETTNVMLPATQRNQISESEIRETTQSETPVTLATTTATDDHDRSFTNGSHIGTEGGENVEISDGEHTNMETFITFPSTEIQRPSTEHPVPPETSTTETMHVTTQSIETIIVTADPISTISSVFTKSKSATEQLKAFTINYLEMTEAVITEPLDLEFSSTKPNQINELNTTENVQNTTQVTTLATPFKNSNDSFSTSSIADTELDSDRKNTEMETYITFTHTTTTPTPPTEVLSSDSVDKIATDFSTILPTETNISSNDSHNPNRTFTMSPPLSTMEFVVPITTASVEIDTNPMPTFMEWNAPFASTQDTGNCTDWAVCRGTETLFNINSDLSDRDRSESNSFLQETLSDHLDIKQISPWLVTIYKEEKAVCPGAVFTDETNRTPILVHASCLSQPLTPHQIHVRPALIDGPIINISILVENRDEAMQISKDFLLLPAIVQSRKPVITYEKLFGDPEQLDERYSNPCRLILQQATNHGVNVTSIKLDTTDVCLPNVNSDFSAVENKNSSLSLCLNSDLCTMLDSGGFLMCARSKHWTSGDRDSFLLGYIYADDPCTFSGKQILRRFRLLLFTE